MSLSCITDGYPTGRQELFKILSLLEERERVYREEMNGRQEKGVEAS